MDLWARAHAKGGAMQYMVSWTERLSGSAADNEATNKRALAVFSKWTPEGQEFKAFVQRVDNRGGYALIETDDPTQLLRTTLLFAPFLDFDVQPVLDMTEAVGLMNEAAEVLDSIS